MSKRIKKSTEAESKRLEAEIKKYRGKFVSKRKNRIFYETLANYVKHDSQKAFILGRFILPNNTPHVHTGVLPNKTITASKIGKPQILSSQCSGLEPVRSK